MRKPYVLWLIWQNEKTRQRYHVGNLEHCGDEYVFYYVNKGSRTLKDAIQDEYHPHLAFPNIHKVYRSKVLFGAFERRLPSKQRPDYPNILKNLGLTPDTTEMDLLRVTGGRLVTDSYELVAPIFVYNDHFDFQFYIAGWRYYEGEEVLTKLKPGMSIHLQWEPLNEQDQNAVVILHAQSDHKLGYIPSFYSWFMFKLLEGKGQYQAVIEKIFPMAKPQQKVLISVTGRLIGDEIQPTGNELFLMQHIT